MSRCTDKSTHYAHFHGPPQSIVKGALIKHPISLPLCFSSRVDLGLPGLIPSLGDLGELGLYSTLHVNMLQLRGKSTTRLAGSGGRMCVNVHVLLRPVSSLFQRDCPHHLAGIKMDFPTAAVRRRSFWGCVRTAGEAKGAVFQSTIVFIMLKLILVLCFSKQHFILMHSRATFSVLGSSLKISKSIMCTVLCFANDKLTVACWNEKKRKEKKHTRSSLQLEVRTNWDK